MAECAKVAVCLLAIFAMTVSGQSTAFRFSNTLGSNMVLQRGPAEAVVWGWSTPKDSVTVSMEKFSTVCEADAAGMWQAVLPATASGTPHIITAHSKLNATILTLENVLFGDVYICSGQSNMQFTVYQGFNATAEIVAADKYPDIRVFSVALKASNTPQPELLGISEPWALASAQSIGGGKAWNYFSAVCWFFGRDLYDALGGTVPIGLISNNWGGTTVQSWSSPDALAKCNQTVGEETVRKEQEHFPETFFQKNNEPMVDVGDGDESVRYNGMINPYLNMQISGAIWYQGESNVGAGPRKGAQYYACQFPAMIADWRVKFNQPDFYFGFVQLAPWIAGADNDTLIAELRQSQLAALQLPHVGVATAADKGDPTSPYGSIHPRDKQDDGHRLAMNAIAIHYGNTSIGVYQGPMAVFAEESSTQPFGPKMMQATILITLSPLTILKLVDATCPEKVPPAECSTFEVMASVDNSWHATAAFAILHDKNVVVNGTVPVSAATQKHPVSAIRYGYSSWPVLPLYSSNNFPVLPFYLEL